jgi:hypothetical protein
LRFVLVGSTIIFALTFEAHISLIDGSAADVALEWFRVIAGTIIKVITLLAVEAFGWFLAGITGRRRLLPREVTSALNPFWISSH